MIDMKNYGLSLSPEIWQQTMVLARRGDFDKAAGLIEAHSYGKIGMKTYNESRVIAEDLYDILNDPDF